MARVLMIVFEGVQTLDLTGPAEVFAAAAKQVEEPVYRVECLSVGGGERSTTSSLSVRTRDLTQVRPRPDDTVIVAGGPEQAIRDALVDSTLRAWLVRAQRIVHRMASVCSGAFLLGAAGLLDDRRATTHWSACEVLASQFPR